MRNKLALKLNVETIVREYNGAVAQITAAYDVLQAQQERLRHALGTESVSTMQGVYSIPRYREQVIAEIEKKTWETVINRLGVRRLLSLKKQDALDKQIAARDFPPITVENIYNTMDSLMAQASDFFTEAIQEIYDWMRPRDAYQSNQEWRVEGRVILKNVLKHKPFGGLTINFSYLQEIKALDRTFHILDGQPFVTKHSSSPLLVAIEESPSLGETPYFRFRGYHKGTLHLWFKREDLVDRFNKIGGGNRLQPGFWHN